MTVQNLLVFSPWNESSAILSELAVADVAVRFGDPAWRNPRGAYEDVLAAAARDADALMGGPIRATPISRRVLAAAPRLRIVAKYTVGVDDVDLDAATELGILVTHAPTEANCFNVAETTVALLLTLLKKVRERDTAVRAGAWRTPDLAARFVGRRLSDGYPGITLGLVGLGRIGSRVADLMAPWRIRILACDPYAEPTRFLLHNVQPVDFPTLLRESDAMSFHVPLSRETRGMLGEGELALVKPGAVVVNTARGKLIDEAALARAIADGRIAAAALDAFAEEPLPADSPLRQLGSRVLLSPHAGYQSEGPEHEAGITWATRSVIAALSGHVPDNVYNKEAVPKWLERFSAPGLPHPLARAG